MSFDHPVFKDYIAECGCFEPEADEKCRYDALAATVARLTKALEEVERIGNECNNCYAYEACDHGIRSGDVASKALLAEAVIK